MGYIEIVGNDLQKYEESQRKDRLEKGLEIDRNQQSRRVLCEEKEFFEAKLQAASEQMKVSTVEN